MKTPYFEKKSKKAFLTIKNTPYDYPAHFHTFIEVVHCFSGEQTVVINGENYILTAGDTAFIFPCVLHEYKLESSKRASSLSIMCETEVLSSLFPEILTCVPTLPIIQSRKLSNETMNAFTTLLTSIDQNEIIGYLTVILASAIKILNFNEVFTEQNADLIKSLCLYVEQNYFENLSISALSKKFGYSKSYIAHLFSEKLKIPFRSYLNGVRVQKAYSLLKLKNKSVTEIASEVGFLSINTFTRCFTKVYKQTPSQIKNSRF